jgi:hypothetical protein
MLRRYGRWLLQPLNVLETPFARPDSLRDRPRLSGVGQGEVVALRSSSVTDSRAARVCALFQRHEPRIQVQAKVCPNERERNHDALNAP